MGITSKDFDVALSRALQEAHCALEISSRRRFRYIDIADRVNRTPFTEQTYGGYLRGSKPVLTKYLAALANALEISCEQLIERALELCGDNAQKWRDQHGVSIDKQKLVDDTTAVLDPLRRWQYARNRGGSSSLGGWLSAPNVIWLSHESIRAYADLTNVAVDMVYLHLETCK